MGAMSEIALDCELRRRENDAEQQQPQKPKKTKRQRKYERYDNIEIIEFAKTVAATPNFANSNKQVYMFNSEKKPVLLRCFKQRAEADFDAINTIHFAKNHNYYITINSFVGHLRRAEYLFSFDNVVIDIDNHGTQDWQELDYQIDKLLYLLDNDYEGEFPEVNVVRTGRGVQLWIGLVSFAASLRFIYDWICQYFCDKIDTIIKENNLQLEVDYKASKDVCRVMRLPYTYNQARYGYKARFEHRTDIRYVFQDLLAEFPIMQTKKDSKKRKQNQKDKSGNTKGKNDKYKTQQLSEDEKAQNIAAYRGLNCKRLNFIYQLVSKYEGDLEGYRHNILFLAYNSAVQLNRDNAADKLKALNDKFVEPIPDDEVTAIIDYIDQYGYAMIKNTTFLNWLNAKTEERMQYIGESSRDAERKAARERKEQRNKRIDELKADGKSCAEIAAEVGCSTKTVQRKTKQNKPSKADRDRHIIELKADGLSVRDIAAEVGCSPTTVQTVCKRAAAETAAPAQTKITAVQPQRREYNAAQAVQPQTVNPANPWQPVPKQDWSVTVQVLRELQRKGEI